MKKTDEQLQQEVKEIRRFVYGKEPWISVKDRVPKRSKLVLCLGRTERLKCVYVIASYCTEMWVVSTGIGMGSYPADGRMKITHWMPLPEPPKESDVK